MKTSVSKRASRLGASLGLGLVLLSAMTASASAQTVATCPVGVVSLPVTAGPSTTMVGLPMKSPAVLTSPVASSTTNTITFSGTPFTSGGLSSASSPFFALITSGLQAGRSLKITANDASSITVDITDNGGASVGLDAAGIVLAAGDKVEIIPGDTIGSLFGSSAGTLKVVGGTSAFNADTIGIWNGARFVPYFYSNTLGYWITTGSTVNANNTSLNPNEAIQIGMKSGHAAWTLMVTGVVQDHRLLYKHSGAGTVVLTQKFPANVTLSSIEFAAGPGSLVAGTSAFNSDTVGIWNGARFVPYFKSSTTGKWVTTGDLVTDHATDVIAPGTALSIKRVSARTGSLALLGATLPYTDPKL